MRIVLIVGVLAWLALLGTVVGLRLSTKVLPEPQRTQFFVECMLSNFPMGVSPLSFCLCSEQDFIKNGEITEASAKRCVEDYIKNHEGK